MKISILIISAVLLLSTFLSAQDLYDINTITQIEITFAESNWDYLLDVLYAAGDEERLVGSVQINEIQFDSVGVRYKGNSSYSPNNVKNPFNIKLDHIIDDQKYQNYGTLKLANGYKDPSFVRETLSYEIARNFMPAGLANYCEVTVNGQYIGLYTSVQSVDKYFKNSNFPGAGDIRLKGELASGANPTVTTVWGYHGADSTSYYNYYELKSDEGWADLIEFLEVFNNNPDEMDDYLNVDNHLWMLAFDNLLVNLDAPINFGHNFYLFKDGSDRFNPILWDLNENFGSFSMLLGGQPLNTYQLQKLDPLLNMNDSDYPIVGKVLNIDKYQKMYIAHMRTIIEEIFQNGWYETRAHELQDIIDTDYQSDPNTFYSYSQFLQNINSTAGGGPGSMPVVGITELMDTRTTWLLSQSEFQGTIPEITNQNYTPQTVEPYMTLWINADVADADEVTLYYRSNAYDKFTALEMYDDGNHNDGVAGDGTYGISIQASYDDINYYFYAQNSDQGAFLPQKASREFYEIEVNAISGEVVINEINYNSADDFDAGDWVELYNNDVEDIDISGWVFKDEDDDHIYIIPDNTVLGQDEYLVLCADTALFKTCFPEVTSFIGNFDFGLGGGGDIVRLFNTGGVLIDSVEYDDAAPWPIEPDGNGPTLELENPNLDNSLAENWHASTYHGTPGAINSCVVPMDDVVINEINYNSADDFDAGDWVELYNNDVEDIDISGWVFKDENDDHIFTIPDNTILGQGQYLVLCNDSTLFVSCFPAVNNWVGDFDFGLSGGGELIRLYNSSSDLIDYVEYSDADPWPTEPDGNGPTLELDDPNLDNSLAESWHASTDHGTPGALNSAGVSVDNEFDNTSLLISNYPNPITATTGISFAIPRTAYIELIIYNVKGQQVKTLIKETRSQGEYTITWDGLDENLKRACPGIYLVKLSSDQATKIHKMIVLK